MSLETSGASKKLGPSSGKPGFPGVLLPEHLSFLLKAPAELIMSKKAAVMCQETQLVSKAAEEQERARNNLGERVIAVGWHLKNISVLHLRDEL